LNYGAIESDISLSPLFVFFGINELKKLQGKKTISCFKILYVISMQFNCQGTEAIERFTDRTSPAVDSQLELGKYVGKFIVFL
jgi:hypothetical protein